LLRRVEGDSSPLVDDDQPVTQDVCLGHIVGGDDERLALPALRLDVCPDGVPRLHVHTQGWLVEEDDLRVVEQGASQHQAALHPTRKGAHRVLAPLPEVHQLKQALDAPFDARQVAAVERGVVPQVVHGAQVKVNVGLLRHVPGALPDLFCLALRIVAQHPDLAAVAAQQAGEQVEHRRLARAVGTQQPKDLAALHLERQVVHRDQAAEATSGRLHLDGASFHRFLPRPECPPRRCPRTGPPTPPCSARDSVVPPSATG